MPVTNIKNVYIKYMKMKLDKLEMEFQENKSFQFTCYESAKEREFHNCQISTVTKHA